MDIWRRTLLLTPLLAACFLWMPIPGQSLKCHVCNSKVNDFCDVLKDDRYLMNCSEAHDPTQNHDMMNHTNCRKQVYSVESKEFKMDTTRTVRSCGYEKHPRSSCFYSSNIDLKSSTCECDNQDGCNTASQSKSMSLWIYLLILFMSLTVKSIT